MKSFAKSRFLDQLYSAACSLNSDFRRDPDNDDREFEKYLAFLKMEQRGLTEVAYGWREGEGYSKECSINCVILFLAGMMRRKDIVPMESVMANAMILLSYTEAAWEQYQTLLATYEEAKRGLLMDLQVVVEDKVAQASPRH